MPRGNQGINPVDTRHRTSVSDSCHTNVASVVALSVSTGPGSDNPCQDAGCANSGMCFKNVTSQLGYSCKCYPGFGGALCMCESIIDPRPNYRTTRSIISICPVC